MGDGPVSISGIAMETAANMIVNAAGRHAIQGQLHHIKRLLFSAMEMVAQ